MAESEYEGVVLAACGCCTDGRLGLGDDIAALSTGCVDAITILPWSLEHAHEQGGVKAIACGGYHSFAHTHDGGLYGWGACDAGQLGWGAKLPSASMSIATPTRIPFFDALRTEHSGEEVVDVACGGLHSVVRTTRGLYVAGSNAYGQLGLGDADYNKGHDAGECVRQWRRLCRLPLGLSSSEDGHDEEARDRLPAPSHLSALHPMSASHDGNEREKGVLVSEELVFGDVTHMSCGTHHTLLAWKDAVVRRVVHRHTPDDDGDDDETVTYVYYPALLTACGKGDFGELGDDPDVWTVLRSKDQRVKEAALSAARQGQHQQPPPQEEGQTRAMDGTAPDARAATTSVTSASSPFYSFAQKWEPKVARRPEFFSTFHRKVQQLPPVEAAAVVLAEFNVPGADRVMRGAALAAAVARAKAQVTWNPTTAAAHIVALNATHLHSSVTFLSERPAAERASGTPHDVSRDTALTWHWGCYYNNQIEDMNASVPRLVAETEPWRVHGGNEFLLRFFPTPMRRAVDPSQPPPTLSTQSPWSVLGSGILGLGEDDSFEPTFVPLPLPVERPPRDHSSTSGEAARDAAVSSATPIASAEPYYVRRAAGRDHLIAHMQRTSADLDEPLKDFDMVCGFGSNLYGELGLSVHTVPDGQTTPTCVLRTGDTLGTPASAKGRYRVVKVLDMDAGARHSLFLLRVRREGDS